MAFVCLWIKGPEAQKQRPHELFSMLWFDENNCNLDTQIVSIIQTPIANELNEKRKKTNFIHIHNANAKMLHQVITIKACKKPNKHDL